MDKIRILIVEDEVTLRTALKQLLEISNDPLIRSTEVLLAASGEEAWPIIEDSTGPLLIITDRAMLGMDGLELCRRADELRKTHERKFYIVMLTGKTPKLYLETAYNSGCDEFISKSFEPMEFTLRIRSGLRTLLSQLNCSRDEVTQIWNRKEIRRFCQSEVSRAIREQKPVAVIMIDVDRFKDINDKHGHDAGDLVLARVAEFITANLRDYDLVGRWGGEEFLVVLPDCPLAKVYNRAEKIRTCIESQVIPINGGVWVTVSAGYAVYEPPPEPLHLNSDEIKKIMTDFVKEADVALYEAKASGRNQVKGKEDKVCA